MLEAAVAKRDAIPDIRYGPVQFRDAIVWVLIAACFRYLFKIMPGAVPIGIPLTTFCVFMAFAAAVHSTVTASGGNYRIHRSGFWASIVSMKSVLRKLLEAFLLLAILALLIGNLIDPPKGSIGKFLANATLAFQGLAFSDGSFSARIIGAFFAVIAFLLVVLSAGRQAVTLQNMVILLYRHWLYFAAAVFALTILMHFVQINQLKFGRFIDGLIQPGSPMKGWFYITYQTALAMFRLWVVVTVLAMAHKMSCLARANRN